MRERLREAPARLAPQPSRAASPAALASALGNQAFGRLLRAGRDQASEATLRFEVGRDVTVDFAAAVRASAAGGAAGDAGLRALREAALSGDSSISDPEQLLMAAALDPANVARLQGPAPVPGEVLEVPEASVTAERRARVDALARPAMPPAVEQLLAQASYELLGGGAADPAARFTEADDAAARSIAELTGPFAAVAADAVVVAGRAGLSIASLLAGMLAAASDGTPGDIALAGVVEAIAAAESLPVAADLAGGRIKVDEVPPGAIPRAGAGHERELAAYVTTAQTSGAKGDTLYVPSTLAVTNAMHWSVVVHELEHARQDRDLGGPGLGADTAQAETAAYRAQGASIMRRLLAEGAESRPRVVAEIGAGWNTMVMLAMVLESRADRERADPLIVEVNDAAPADRYFDLRFLDEQFALDPAALEQRLTQRVVDAYGLAEGAQTAVDGLAGESTLDRPAGP